VVARALDLLLERPVLTARLLQQAVDCSHVAANSALADLTQLGILTVQGTPRRRRFIAHEMLRLLQPPM
jgi:Fic family protein